MDHPSTAWDIVESVVLAQPSGRDLHVPKDHLPDPTDAGMHRAIGIPKGTLRHYRRPVRGRSCLHVREYADRYEVHWDRHDPRRAPLAHWLIDVRGGRWSAGAFALGLVTLAIAFV